MLSHCLNHPIIKTRGITLCLLCHKVLAYMLFDLVCFHLKQEYRYFNDFRLFLQFHAPKVVMFCMCSCTMIKCLYGFRIA